MTGLTRGVYQGTNGPLRSTLIPSFFGRKHIGQIQGIQTMIQISGTAFGPLLLGIGHALTGEYASTLRGLCVLPATLG